MILGFTGTREGMSGHQMMCFEWFARELIGAGLVERFHFGAAEGADAEAVRAVLGLGLSPDKIVAHPCHADAFKKLARHVAESRLNAMEWRPVKPPLRRNRDIVAWSGLLVAAPRLNNEEVRSGTWATVRYMREARKPVLQLSR